MIVREPAELGYLRDQEQRQQQDESREAHWGFDMLVLAEMVSRWGKAAIQQELASMTDKPQTEVRRVCGMCSYHRTAPIEHCSLRAQADFDCVAYPATSTHAENCPFFQADCPF